MKELRTLIVLLLLLLLLIFMPSYLEKGYNIFLEQPLVPEQGQSALDFQALVEDGVIDFSKLGAGAVGTLNLQNAAVTAAKIKDLSWDSGYGGTLELGGKDNQAGTFSLKDENELERIKMNKDGVEINEGKVTIKDKTNKTFIDSQGLVSTATFQSNSVEQSVEQVTSSDTWADISGVSLNIPNLTKNTKFLFLFTALLYAEDATYASVAVRLDVDGISYRPWLIFTQGDDPNVDRVDAQLSTFKFLTLGAGTHTAKLQFRKWEVGAYGYADQIILSYIQLGN